MSFEGIAVASAGLVIASGGAAGVVLTQGVMPVPVPPAPAPTPAPVAESAAPPPEPASPSRVEVAPAVRADRPSASVTTARSGARPTGGIPGRALQAYQVAASVMENADPTCRLDWQLLAGVGLVESDHGRSGGSRLSADGVAIPAILGPALDGTGDFSRVADTDGGDLDGDNRVDRAVGPMQFLPSTWWAVAVDGDGDGTRNPQDLDDAALGAAVYLCFGEDDLGTVEGRRTALFRYNHSDAYVEEVLAARAAYLADMFPTGARVGVSAVARTFPGTMPGAEPAAQTGPRGSARGGVQSPGGSDPKGAPDEPRDPHDGPNDGRGDGRGGGTRDDRDPGATDQEPGGDKLGETLRKIEEKRDQPDVPPAPGTGGSTDMTDGSTP
jgi:membrane-bound lytic murein transglycosylase B